MDFLEAFIAQVAVEHGRSALLLGRAEGATSADDEQIVQPIVVEVAPGKAGPHILREL